VISAAHRDVAAACQPAPRYAALAPAYDASIGRPVFARTRFIFESFARRYGLRFRDALDLGCGTGLFCRYLAVRWRVPAAGVDLSPHMLRIAARNCRGLPVTLLRGDIARLRLPFQTDLVSCNFDTLNHLTRPGDARAAIARAAAHLRPGGAFFFDFLTPCQRFPPHRPLALRAGPPGRRVAQVLRWSPAAGLLSVRVILERPGGPPLSERHLERLYEPAAVLRWLAASGLRTLCARDAAAKNLDAPPAQAARVAVLAIKPR
jgi:SAM-dependent methyltransferase